MVLIPWRGGFGVQVVQLLDDLRMQKLRAERDSLLLQNQVRPYPEPYDRTSLDPTQNRTSMDPTSYDRTSLDPTSYDRTSMDPTSYDRTSLDPTQTGLGSLPGT